MRVELCEASISIVAPPVVAVVPATIRTRSRSLLTSGFFFALCAVAPLRVRVPLVLVLVLDQRVPIPHLLPAQIEPSLIVLLNPNLRVLDDVAGDFAD